LTDRVFGFGPTASGADVFGQTLRLAETWGGRAREFLGPWAEALQKLADVSPALATGDPEAQRKAFDHLQAAFQETFGKLLKMPAVGKDREATELLLRTVDRWSVFVAKNAEFQAEIQKIAQQAMKEVVEVLAQKVRDGQELGGIEELIKLWAETNEKAFLDLFRTEQFARLQGLLLDAALDARRHVQRLLEHCLKDFPVALRSEMDDVYQTAHALKRSVRALGRKSAEVEALRDELRRLEQRIAALEKGSSATDEEAAR
jgi:class III poly(R)-hydroxyalkanoic acid synthase PhaE subunit